MFAVGMLAAFIAIRIGFGTMSGVAWIAIGLAAVVVTIPLLIDLWNDRASG